MIDHIFLSPNLAQTYGADDYFIVAADKDPPDYLLALSDHRPVLVRLSLNSNQPDHESVIMRNEKGFPESLRERLAVLEVDAGAGPSRSRSNGSNRGDTSVSVPLSVAISGDEINLSARLNLRQLTSLMGQPSTEVSEEAVTIDPNYSKSQGLQPEFSRRQFGESRVTETVGPNEDKGRH